MNLIISFSGRSNGNCDKIEDYISSEADRIVYFRDLNVHPCQGCDYECFQGECKYRADDIYSLYSDMCSYDKVILNERVKDFIWLTVEDVKLVLRQPDINKKTGIRDRFFIALMYESGCRDDEILHMRFKNIVK